MTPLHSVSKKKSAINWRNFRKAARIARDSGALTAMITGKGEPLLFPTHITDYLTNIADYDFPILELQTNGLLLHQRPETYRPLLKQWYALGLTTIAISIVHYEASINREVYLPHASHYPPLEEIIQMIHEEHISVRLACVMCKGMIDAASSFAQLVAFSRKHNVEQLSARPVNAPSDPKDLEAHAWTERHRVSKESLDEIASYVHEHGTVLQRLSHGAAIYDLFGQNVCITNSLTTPTNGENIRQLIYFPDGTITYDWQHSGAIIMRGIAA